MEGWGLLVARFTPGDDAKFGRRGCKGTIKLLGKGNQRRKMSWFVRQRCFGEKVQCFFPNLVINRRWARMERHRGGQGGLQPAVLQGWRVGLSVLPGSPPASYGRVFQNSVHATRLAGALLAGGSLKGGLCFLGGAKRKTL